MMGVGVGEGVGGLRLPQDSCKFTEGFHSKGQSVWLGIQLPLDCGLSHMCALSHGSYQFKNESQSLPWFPQKPHSIRFGEEIQGEFTSQKYKLSSFKWKLDSPIFKMPPATPTRVSLWTTSPPHCPSITLSP